MNKALVLGLLLLGAGACKKERVASCDKFLETAEKLAKCEKLPEASRKTIQSGADTMREGLKQLDDAGGAGKAPKDLVDMLSKTCSDQEKTIVEGYKTELGDCLK